MTDKLVILEKINLSLNSFILWLLIAFQINSGSEGGGGGVLGFQVTGMIEWGEKKNPEKSQNRKFIDSNNPMPNF